MHHHHQGWALFEIVIAMALMGMAIVGLILLQGTALSVSQRALTDTQALGLANELLESHAMGLQSSTSATKVNHRLKHLARNHSVVLTNTPQGQSVLVLIENPNRPWSDVRWQLPIEP